MTTYTIYLGAHPIACVSTGKAWEVYFAAKTIAEATNCSATLVWDETGEIVAEYEGWEEFQ